MKDNKIKVFLLGSYRNNAGPDNVNVGIDTRFFRSVGERI